MNIVTSTKSHPIEGHTVQQLLTFTGLPRAAVYVPRCTMRAYGPSFWDRNHHQLPYILRDAQRAWRAQLKRHHPDRGGDPAMAAALNRAWKRIRHYFSLHGATLD